MADKDVTMDFLSGTRIVNLALNLPGPAAARRLAQMGAQLIKVEPPTGDPMEQYSPDWYRELITGQELIRLDLKTLADRSRFDAFLGDTDLLITANRPQALEALKLTWAELHSRFPRLCQVAIVGYAPPQENVAGHDLTYQAALGILNPPYMPRTLMVDLLGAERTVWTALGLLMARDRDQQGGYAQVNLSDAAATMADPLIFGLTTPGGLLGGGAPEYNIYETQGGWVAVAALEPRFKKRLADALGDEVRTLEQYRQIFRTKTAKQWEDLGQELDIPIAVIHTP